MLQISNQETPIEKTHENEFLHLVKRDKNICATHAKIAMQLLEAESEQLRKALKRNQEAQAHLATVLALNND